MRVKLLSLAEADLLAGFRFYEQQARGLGSHFLDTLYSDIESLESYGGIHRRVFGYHRMISRKFPFGIYYEIQGDMVKVWRVLDCRRDPRRTKAELGEIPIAGSRGK